MSRLTHPLGADPHLKPDSISFRSSRLVQSGIVGRRLNLGEEMLISSSEMMVEIVDKKYVIFVHPKKAPSDQVWSKLRMFLQASQGSLEDMRGLVITDGGGPSPSQRKDFQALMPKDGMRTAVITDAAIMRFVVSSLSLFNSLIRSFDVNELNRALDFLDIPPGAQQEIIHALKQIYRGPSSSNFATLGRLFASDKSLA